MLYPQNGDRIVITDSVWLQNVYTGQYLAAILTATSSQSVNVIPTDNCQFKTVKQSLSRKNKCILLHNILFLNIQMIFLTIKTELSHRLQNTDTVQPVRIPHIPPMHKSKKF